MKIGFVQRNKALFEQVVPAIVEHASDAILLVVSNPVDIMTHLTAHFAARFGVPSSRVIGSGTTPEAQAGGSARTSAKDRFHPRM